MVKLVITDIDGVWTDGGMYYDIEGNELKKFNTSDSAGVLLLREAGIPLAIITGEDTPIVERRAKKLSVDYVFMGVRNKLKIASELCERLGISLHETAFIGDDILDVPLLRAAGYTATPANAVDYIRKEAKIRLINRGGEGAFREFIEMLLSEEQLLEAMLDRLYNKLSAFNI